MFDSVSHLASTFLKLNFAGCVFFRKWNATFYCDRTRPVHSVVDFGLTNRNNENQEYVLHGRRSETGDVLDEVKLVSEFLETCLNEWNHMIDVQRDQFYFLNHYTTEQLVILCQDLAKFCQKRECSPRIFQLLHAVKPDCKFQELVDATSKAIRDLKTRDSLAEREDRDTWIDNEAKDNDSSTQRLVDIANFFKEVEEAGYSREHVKKALTAIGGDPTKVDDGIKQFCYLT